MTPAVAAVDWGTSSFRLWLLDREGKALGERRSGEGLLAAGTEGFQAVLEKHLAAVEAPPALPVIVCGMAGARQGWMEAPYVTVPSPLPAILSQAVRVPGVARDVRIVPGLAQRTSDRPDVMRGEETQLAGLSGLLDAGRSLVCMPGTHSKWVEAQDGGVTGFRTFMTGELFSLLARHSILRHSLGDEAAPVTAASAGFLAGLQRGLAGLGDIGGQLFQIRAASLLHGTSAEEAAAGLSGLLVGSEMAAAKRMLGVPDRPVILVASGSMAALYRAGLEAAGFAVRAEDADRAVRAGLFSAARQCGMVTT